MTALTTTKVDEPDGRITYATGVQYTAKDGSVRVCLHATVCARARVLGAPVCGARAGVHPTVLLPQQGCPPGQALTDARISQTLGSGQIPPQTHTEEADAVILATGG